MYSYYFFYKQNNVITLQAGTSKHTILYMYRDIRETKIVFPTNYIPSAVLLVRHPCQHGRQSVFDHTQWKQNEIEGERNLVQRVFGRAFKQCHVRIFRSSQLWFGSQLLCCLSPHHQSTCPCKLVIHPRYRRH